MNVFNAFPALVDRLGLPRRHLVHVGAHEGQEMPYYRAAGFSRVTLVEPIPELASKLRAAWPDAEVVQAACGSQPGRRRLHLMRRSNMSTLATPAAGDRVAGTIEVEVRRLAEVAPTANVVVIDAQGMELDVLAGADLAGLDAAIVETCTVPDATMAASYQAVAEFMGRHRFVEAESWVRDYDRVHRWARGRPSRHKGEIRDVTFVKENHA